MKKDYWIDYWGYTALKLLGPLIRALPLFFSFFIGRRLGDLFYCLDGRHRAIAYSNIKRALGNNLSCRRIKKITRQFYQAYGQNFIEIFLIPRIDRAYIDKYVSFEGLPCIKDAIARGRGQIFLGVHAGSWELSSLFCMRFGVAYNIFVRNQRYPRLGQLLDSYRSQKGARMIKKENELRQLLRAFENNEAVGMSLDQGGREGMLLDFFGKDASFATGAVRLALKYNLAIVPTFNTRVRGPYLKFMLGPIFEVQRSGDIEDDLRSNLKRLVAFYEDCIRRYPKDYLWSYKVWKYSLKREILILSDGKTGHLRQSQALARIAGDYLASRGFTVNTTVREIRFRNRWKSFFLKLKALFSGRYSCQGCLCCLRNALNRDVYQSLTGKAPDVVISCGSSLAAVNWYLTRESLAKSIVIMKPSLVSSKKFDLMLLPQHDLPAVARNVVVTQGALNMVDVDYLRLQGQRLKQHLRGKMISEACIGVLFGGDSKGFSLEVPLVSKVIRQLKDAAEALGADILVTTSRRTSSEVEELVKDEFRGYPQCKLLVIASEENYDFAMGGILSLSSLLVVSPESISMISEAVNSARYVVVFEAGGLSPRHQRFLKTASENRHIYLSGVSSLASLISGLWKDKPAVSVWDDNKVAKEALEEVL